MRRWAGLERRRMGGFLPAAALVNRALAADGSAYARASGAGGRWLFPAIGSGLVTTVALWVRLHSKGTTQRLLQVGDDTSVATVVAGIDYAAFSDRFRVVASNGSVFTALSTGFAPAVDTWYLLVAGFGEGALGLTSWNLAGQIESISTGLVQPGYNPVASPALGLLAAPDGALPVAAGGRVDSVGFWSRASLPGAAPLWNGGLALEFAAVPAPFSSGLSLWADFNEPSGAASYADGSGGAALTAFGAGLTTAPGAGY